MSGNSQFRQICIVGAQKCPPELETVEQFGQMTMKPAMLHRNVRHRRPGVLTFDAVKKGCAFRGTAFFIARENRVTAIS